MFFVLTLSCFCIKHFQEFHQGLKKKPLQELKLLNPFIFQNGYCFNNHEVPSKAFIEDWQCDQKYHLCTDIQKSEIFRTKNAVLPHAYTGDLMQLFKQLTHARNQQKLNIVVFGNSVTQGKSCNRKPWPKRLQEILRLPLKNWTVDIKIFAHGGTTSQGALYDLGKQNCHNAIKAANIVLVDMSTGDTLRYRGQTVESIQKVTSTLIQTVSFINNPPTAIIYIEFMPAGYYFQFRKSCENANMLKKNQACSPCNMDVRTFPHWKALTKLQVPVLSYFDIICRFHVPPFFFNGSLSYWGQISDQHPSCDAHEVFAHVIAEFIYQHIPGNCLKIQSTALSHTLGPTNAPVLTHAKVSSNLCLLHWTVVYDSTTWLKEQSENRENRTTNSGENINAYWTGPKSFPGIVSKESWIYMEDVKDKPGWISQRGQLGTITFQLGDLKRGEIILEYLQTYNETFGYAFCRIDQTTELRLDALIESKISISAFARLTIANNTSRDMTSSNSSYNITCRSSGKKFKLISIRAC